MSSQYIFLPHTPEIINTSIPLVSSKSESNRAIIIQNLSKKEIKLYNLAEARDTQTMLRLVKSTNQTLDVLDAGTTMRFLTAFCAASNRRTILTGTERMQQRPIGILVDALKAIGTEIQYLNKEGFPPIAIKKFQQISNKVSVRGDVSSQYISALLMIAPILSQGLTIHLIGEVGSIPYITMTLALMKRFGISYEWEGNAIVIPHQKYSGGDYTIESDWSGASYWYSLVALSENGSLFLEGLRENSFQGDYAIIEIMQQLGVKTEFNDKGAKLTKTGNQPDFEYDFTHCPDLAQTISVICAAKGVNAKLTGLKSLRIKETDRIAAIQEELAKMSVNVEIIGDEAIYIPKSSIVLTENLPINTYDDHRMAMAFAPLACIHSLKIEDPSVVNKSYPSFWKHLELVGIKGIIKLKNTLI